MRTRLIFHAAWNCQLGRTVGGVGWKESRTSKDRVVGMMRRERARVCVWLTYYGRHLFLPTVLETEKTSYWTFGRGMLHLLASC